MYLKRPGRTIELQQKQCGSSGQGWTFTIYLLSLTCTLYFQFSIGSGWTSFEFPAFANATTLAATLDNSNYKIYHAHEIQF